jgi:hypothetical protein
MHLSILAEPILQRARLLYPPPAPRASLANKLTRVRVSEFASSIIGPAGAARAAIMTRTPTHSFSLSIASGEKACACFHREDAAAAASLSSPFTPAPRSADSEALLCAGEIEFAGERRTARVQTL